MNKKKSKWLEHTRNENTDKLAQAGFTLIEVLIVVAILGILANITIPAVLNQLTKAKATRIVTEYKLLQNAEFSYQTDTDGTLQRRVIAKMPPELARYVNDQNIRWVEGSGSKRLRKYFVRETRKKGGLAKRGVTGGLMIRSRDTDFLDRIDDVFTGPKVRWKNGKTIVLLF